MAYVHEAPSLERIREVFDCDPHAGILRWKIRTSNRINVGDVAGRFSGGYFGVGLDGVRYQVHRVIWYYVYGEWVQLDHRDLNRSHNSIDNLRPASPSQNLHNIGLPKHNTSGFKGACHCPQRGKNCWIAQIAIDGERHFLGGYPTAEEAHAAYMRAAEAAFGEFARAA